MVPNDQFLRNSPGRNAPAALPAVVKCMTVQSAGREEQDIRAMVATPLRGPKRAERLEVCLKGGPIEPPCGNGVISGEKKRATMAMQRELERLTVG